METATAILLRKVRLTDTSLIITWLGPDCGRIKTVAKGALRPKSPFAGKLDLCHSCEITFARSARSELHALRDVSVTSTHTGIRTSYPRLRTAAYFIELLEQTLEPEHPASEPFTLLERALVYLDNQDPSRKAVLHFESELARLLGIHGDATRSTAAAALEHAAHRLPRDRTALLQALNP